MALERWMCPLEKLCAQHVPVTGLFGVTCAFADKTVKLMDVDFMAGNLMNEILAGSNSNARLLFGASASI